MEEGGRCRRVGSPPCEFSHISLLLLLFPLPLSPLHIDSLELSQFRHFVRRWSSFSSPSAHLSLSPNCKVRRSVIHSGRKGVSGSGGRILYAVLTFFSKARHVTGQVELKCSFIVSSSVFHEVIIRLYFHVPGRRRMRLEHLGISGFTLIYEGWSTHSHNHVISMQPLGIGPAIIPHMKPLRALFKIY